MFQFWSLLHGPCISLVARWSHLISGCLRVLPKLLGIVFLPRKDTQTLRIFAHLQLPNTNISTNQIVINPYRAGQILPILRCVPSVTKVMLLHFIHTLPSVTKVSATIVLRNSATLHAFLI